MRPSSAVIAAFAACFLAGCASEGTGPRAGSSSVLPAALTSRWTPPAFATRVVDAERAAALDAAVSAANALGFEVNRVDAARGKVFAARRPSAAFDGARQETLEASISVIGPGATQVALVLREAVEGAGADERGAMVTTALVRERAIYDAFFARLGAALPPPAALPSSAP